MVTPRPGLSRTGHQKKLFWTEERKEEEDEDANPFFATTDTYSPQESPIGGGLGKVCLSSNQAATLKASSRREEEAHQQAVERVAQRVWACARFSPPPP